MSDAARQEAERRVVYKRPGCVECGKKAVAVRRCPTHAEEFRAAQGIFCEVEGCSRGVAYKTLCAIHYLRKIRNKPLDSPIKLPAKPVHAGDIFGQLQVVEFDDMSSATKHPKWKCQCTCGQVVTVRAGHLRSGETKSCGHDRAEPNPDSYHAVHQRISVRKGLARFYKCVDCGALAAHWSYNQSGNSEQKDIVGGRLIVYSTDIEQYEPRCAACHARFDYAASMTRKGRV